jgi:hypothetical protein
MIKLELKTPPSCANCGFLKTNYMFKMFKSKLPKIFICYQPSLFRLTKLALDHNTSINIMHNTSRKSQLPNFEAALNIHYNVIFQLQK